MQGRFGEGAPCPYKLVPPPGDFFHADIVEVVCSFEGLNDSLFGHIVLFFDHLIDLLELLIDLFHNEPVFIIQHFFVLFNLHINVLYLIQLLFQDSNVLLIVLRNIGDGVFAWHDSVILVDCTSINAVHTEEFILIFTVEGNEVVVEEAFLRHLCFVGDSIKVKACAKVLLTRLEGFNIFSVVLLQQDRCFGRRSLLPHVGVGIRRIGQRLSLFTV